MNTTYFLNLVAGNLFGTKTTPGIPSGYWIGLSTSGPTTEGENVGEPNLGGTGYSRVLLDSLSAPTGGEITNTTPVSFPESLTDWGTMLHYVVFDSQTEGNLLFYGPLSISRSVEPNTVITIKTGELSVTLSNPA